MKTYRIEFRVAEKEFKDFKKACDREGRQVSDTLRRWMLHAVLRKKRGETASPTLDMIRGTKS